MKRLVATGLVAVCVIAVAFGAEVVSENVVGFITVSAQAGKYTLVCAQFDSLDTASPTIVDVLGTNVPDSTVVYTYNGSTYVAETFYEGYGWDPGTTVIDRDMGFWLYSSGDHDFILKGEVPDYDTPITLAAGYQLMGYPYPAGEAVTNTVIGSNAGDGDVIYLYNGTTYVPYTYYDGYGWDPEGLVFPESGGFWYFKNSVGSTNFNETPPYSL